MKSDNNVSVIDTATNMVVATVPMTALLDRSHIFANWSLGSKPGPWPSAF